MIARVHVGQGGMTVQLDGPGLLAACAARGWSLTELARRAGISRPTLHKAFSGGTIRPSTARRLTQVFELATNPGHSLVEPAQSPPPNAGKTC
jgi:transcriptional regulator with XRE-family HTH domain